MKTINGDMFDAYVAYLRQTATSVEKVYRFEKAGGFVGGGSPESRAFAGYRQYLRIWYKIFQHPYLKGFSAGERSGLATAIIRSATAL